MRTFLIITIIVNLKVIAFSQTLSSVKWIKQIDTSEFIVSKDKNQLPKTFLEFIGREKSEIAINDTDFSKCCLGPKNHTRLNWVAKDGKKYLIISFSFSGRGSQWTNYFFIQKSKIYTICIRLPNNEVLSFRDLILDLRKNDYELEDY